jgi:hypothetical protein
MFKDKDDRTSSPTQGRLIKMATATDYLIYSGPTAELRAESNISKMLLK